MRMRALQSHKTFSNSGLKMQHSPYAGVSELRNLTRLAQNPLAAGSITGVVQDISVARHVGLPNSGKTLRRLGFWS